MKTIDENIRTDYDWDDTVGRQKQNKRKGLRDTVKAGLFGAGFLLMMTGTLKECNEVNSMTKQDNIENIVEQAACGHNGQLHYQRPITQGEHGFSEGFRSYCLVNGDNCPFYQSKGVFEYCHAPIQTYQGEKE